MTDYSTILLALDIWREASNQSYDAKVGVGRVVQNRANHPGWWGHNIVEVITHKWQFSSMSAPGDPNLIRWPHESDPSWIESLTAAGAVLTAPVASDITQGATYYYSVPLTSPPMAWGPVTETAKIGAMHFCKPIEKLDE